MSTMPRCINWLFLLSLVAMSFSLGSKTTFGKPFNLKTGELDRITEWLGTPPEERGELLIKDRHQREISRAQLQPLSKQIWEAYREMLVNTLPSHLVPQLSDIEPPRGAKGMQVFETEINNKTMPFVIVEKGIDPEVQPSLFICLHGGGSAGGSAAGPHEWPVNTQEWAAQVHLAKNVYQPNGIYCIPRMPDDNDGRWWYDYCQEAYDRIIRTGIALKNINPDRVYLLGISEGGYGSYRLGAHMADRWAAVGPMSAGERVGNAPPENLRNLAFRTDVGEHDKMFDRVGLARSFHDAIQDLHVQDERGYTHLLNVQEGRGHGVDYSLSPTWLAEHVRNPWPQSVVWNPMAMHGVERRHMYWLSCTSRKSEQPILLRATILKEDNRIDVEAHQLGPEANSRTPLVDASLSIRVNDEMLDLDSPVKIFCNGKEVFQETIKRKLETMVRTLDERGDPRHMYPSEIQFSL